MWIEQGSTLTVKVGPFVDDTDGHTAENALNLLVADIILSKNGGAQAAKNEATAPGNADAANIGWYNVILNGTDTNTLGHLVLAVDKAGALPVWHEYMVVTSNTYDSLVLGTDYVQTDAIQIEGADATNTIDARVTAMLQAIDLDHLMTTACPGNVITGAVADDTALAFLAAIGGDISDYDNATDSLEALGAGLPTAAAVADAVWDEQEADHQAVGSFGLAQSTAAIADDVWDEVIEAGAPVNARTARQLVRIFASALAGRTAGVGDWSALSLDELKTRIAATLDANGHRIDITTLDGS